MLLNFTVRPALNKTSVHLKNLFLRYLFFFLPLHFQNIDQLYMSIENVKLDLLFETSWEVCNKIGGIYTVLSTKAKTLQKLYKDKVIFIGPDVWNGQNPSPFFIEAETTSSLKTWQSKTQLPDGLTVRIGRWNIPGKPIAILVGFDSMYAKKDELYGKMWELYKVDSLHSYGDYDEACAFSHAAAIVIESICRYKKAEKKTVVAHFNEWTTGMGLLYTKWKLPYVATVFTTHATSIGRSICGNGKPLYDYMKGYNGDQMAQELNMQSKHSLEKAAAWAADCFTTVSDITAIECQQLLDLKPHVITPNGFERNFVPSKTEFGNKRAIARETLLNVASSLTGREFSNDTFIVSTSGRCEYRNKGIDVYLDSINNLRDCSATRQILAFVMVPAWVNSYRKDLHDALGNPSKHRCEDPVITHWLNEPWNDPIYSHIHRFGVGNNDDSNLTIIYVPCYLNGDDGIFQKTYYDLLIGMDATVFPSYYEPWGYTPLESIAFGVPTLTTSLSGFGQWILSSGKNDIEQNGVAVIDRTDSNYTYVTTQIASHIKDMINADDTKRKKISSAAMSTASEASWDNFIKYYIDAFKTALSNAEKRK